MKKNQNEMFLSKSVSFAIEMVRASLRHTPTNIRLDGLWMQMNIGTDLLGSERSGMRNLLFSILISPNINIEANCIVVCVGGEWKSGDLEIRLLDSKGCYAENNPRWKFRCQLNNASGQIDVESVQ